MEAFKIENLEFTYPLSDEKALDNISLTVEKGELIVVCGRSGCGKTTLLQHLKPSLAPIGTRQGEISFCGEKIDDLDSRAQAEKIGFVMQNTEAQLVCDKVWQELAFGLENLGMATDEIRIRVAEVAAFFELDKVFHSRVCELSGGQKQLLNLASVMVMNPEIVILDEPTSQLDPIAAQKFLDTLVQLNRDFGVTVIISEHRLEGLLEYADRVIVMEKGQIISNSTPENIIDNIKGFDIYEGLPVAMRVFSAMGEEGVSPVSVRDGRRWLYEKTAKHSVLPVAISEKELPKGQAAFVFDDVWFRYEKNGVDILNGFSATINKGEIYSLVGGNAAGKTTLLKLAAGVLKPYRGKITAFDKSARIGMVPQNPRNLFTEKTVIADLERIEKDEEKIQLAAKMCEIGSLLTRNPFDLSGGELQRAALAKVLLANPDIMLLDEPTKGMDACFKNRLAQVLKRLRDRGLTIMMVSHDIDFCAEVSNRCGMLFDGQKLCEGSPHRFFADKKFYTTAANRMAKDIIPNAVLVEDIIAAFGRKFDKAPEKPEEDVIPKKFFEHKKEQKTKAGLTKIIAGIIALGIFAVLQLWFYDKYNFDDWRTLAIQVGAMVFAAMGVLLLLPDKRYNIQLVKAEKKKSRLTKRTLLAAVMVLVAIPLTIYAGIRFFGDRQYYLTSLLIIFEIMLPFFVSFEKKRPRAKELMLISLVCAIAVAGRMAFFMLPQFKPIIAMVIIAGVAFGGETGFLVGAVCAFVSNFYFGQGPWTPWQMFGYGVIGFLAGVVFQRGIIKSTRLSLSIFGGLSTIIIFGGITNPTHLIMMGEALNIKSLAAVYASGLPFDLVHAAATVVFLWVLAEPMLEKLERIKIKYGD